MNSNIILPRLEEFIITKSLEHGGCFHLHVELERKSHKCPRCGFLTQKIHDYRKQRIQHTKVFSREAVIFYRKRRYKCSNSNCNKSFYESNQLVERYQRQSIELKQAIALELIHGKNFEDVTSRFNTFSNTKRNFNQ